MAIFEMSHIQFIKNVWDSNKLNLLMINKPGYCNIQFISAITKILPVSFMYILQMCITCQFKNVTSGQHIDDAQSDICVGEAVVG